MRSDLIKKGIERAPHRSLLRAVGCSSDDWDNPFIGVISSFTEVVPGHIHLQAIAEAVKEGSVIAGENEFSANTCQVKDLRRGESQAVSLEGGTDHLIGTIRTLVSSDRTT